MWPSSRLGLVFCHLFPACLPHCLNSKLQIESFQGTTSALRPVSCRIPDPCLFSKHSPCLFSVADTVEKLNYEENR